MKMLKFAYLAIESSSSPSRINKLEDAFVLSSCSLSNMYKKKKDNKKERPFERASRCFYLFEKLHVHVLITCTYITYIFITDR